MQENQSVPAQRITRLIAYLIDTVVVVMAMLGVAFNFELWPLLWTLDPEQIVIIHHSAFNPATLQFALFVMINGFFLFLNGQTLGKLIMGIRIVNDEGKTPPLWNLLLVRSFLFFYLPFALAPFIGTILSFGGALFFYFNILSIFKPGARCLHDHLAKTYVVVCD